MPLLLRAFLRVSAAAAAALLARGLRLALLLAGAFMSCRFRLALFSARTSPVCGLRSALRSGPAVPAAAAPRRLDVVLFPLLFFAEFAHRLLEAFLVSDGIFFIRGAHRVRDGRRLCLAPAPVIFVILVIFVSVLFSLHIPQSKTLTDTILRSFFVVFRTPS